MKELLATHAMNILSFKSPGTFMVNVSWCNMLKYHLKLQVRVMQSLTLLSHRQRLFASCQPKMAAGISELQLTVGCRGFKDARH